MCVSASSSYFSSSPSLQKWFVPTLTFGVPANACDTYTHSQNTNALIRESGHLHVTPTRAFRSPSYQKVTFQFFFFFVRSCRLQLHFFSSACNTMAHFFFVLSALVPYEPLLRLCSSTLSFRWLGGEKNPSRDSPSTATISSKQQHTKNKKRMNAPTCLARIQYLFLALNPFCCPLPLFNVSH